MKRTLEEFQIMTGLSDAALLQLLRSKKLDCSIDAERGILIDCTAVPVKLLVESVREARKNCLTAYDALQHDRIRAVIAEELGLLMRAVKGS